MMTISSLTYTLLGSLCFFSAFAQKKEAPPLRPKKDIKQYNGRGKPNTAVDQQKLFHLPEGYEIELVAQENTGIGKFVSVSFDQQGRMWTQTALEYPVDGKENRAAAEALYKGKGADKILVYSREALNKPLPLKGLTNPTVFADGLAMPLGMLPWGAGDDCYAMHGHDLVKLSDTNADGISDKREVILTGFGVQDSHLFPHQFTRAPGDWLWLAQGLYNTSKVKRPGDDKVTPFLKCSMARMRTDGTEFEVTSTGPNNIWGLIITGEGESFIQEANDFGHSVVEFHDYAYYPGGMKSYRKSYQPEMPSVDFRLGGTGLSGLALLENGPQAPSEGEMTFLLANAITSTINTVGVKRDGAYPEYAHLPDFITCDDPWFRPVALTQGPDGCIYIVDWYNKIISHNEVARNHPDRDRSRGRIWRIKPTDGKGLVTIPDFSKQSTQELVAALGTSPTAKSHLVWQTLADRKSADVPTALKAALTDPSSSDAKRIQAFWALSASDRSAARSLATSANRNVRRELARYPEFADLFLEDSDREVRFATIQTLAKQLPENATTILPKLLSFARASIKNPETTRSSRSPSLIPIRGGYDREFERFLVRRFLEKNRKIVIQFLDSDAAHALPVEAVLLANLSLDPKVGSSRIARLLPALDRAPNAEEILILAKFPKAPGTRESLTALLAAPETAGIVVQTLLNRQTSLNPKTIGPVLIPAVKAMITADQVPQASRLIGAFQLRALEPQLIAVLKNPSAPEDHTLAALAALRLIQSREVEVFSSLAAAPTTPAVGEAALIALAESKSPQAGKQIITLYPKLNLIQQRDTLTRLSSKKQGAQMLIAAILDGRLPREVLDGPMADRLVTLLPDSPELAQLMRQMKGVFKPVLTLDGTPAAWAETNLTLAGPFTIESWVSLAPGITNADGLLGSAGQFDLKFSDSKLRLWLGKGLGNVVVATTPMTPDLWTHVAITRNAENEINLYLDGELNAQGTKKVSATFTDLNVGWTNAKQAGTQAKIAEYRVWNIARSAQEIRQTFDRSFAAGPPPKGLSLYNSGGDPNWGTLSKGAKITQTTDAPPLLTSVEATALDAQFAKYLKLGALGGNPENGKIYAAVCTACHVIKGSGGQIGPDLSGTGAMGMEAVLRNILTPNAAMESGYRIFRVTMKNGDLLEAFYVSQDRRSMVIRQPGGADQRIAKKDIASSKFIRRSLMPEGLLDHMSDEMAADLLAYLMTLK